MQQPRAAAGRVHLLAGRDEARAHHVHAVGIAAAADADAADRRVAESRRDPAGRRTRRAAWPSAAPSLRSASSGRGSTTLPGFIFPSGSQIRLNSRNACTSSVAEHAREQLGARLPVAVLAGERAAVGDDEVGGLLDEAPVARDPAAAREVEVVADVHAALAEVAVVDAPEAVPRRERPQVAQVVADPLGRHRRVLPALPVVLALRERGDREPDLAHLRELLGARRRPRRAGRRSRPARSSSSSASARARASSSVSPPSSTTIQPLPSGSRSSASTFSRASRSYSTSRSSKPSRPSGRCASTSATWSPAVATSS